MSNNSTSKNKGRTRPRQVLLVGLGGVGSRTVDEILSVMPEKYRAYTKAIAIDTDIGELEERIRFIPDENRLALGSNPDNGQSVTVGEYIREHAEVTEWFVKGGHLDTIKARNTAQGAKQVRMVSRIALAATNDFCGMKEKLSAVLHDLNVIDGADQSQGLLVMVICSIAGGTGAGTVLQFPLYLEQALSGSFSEDRVQIECSMLLPNVFSTAHDPENGNAAKANAYAVVRELMSLNSGRLKRGDLLPDDDVESKNQRKSPYGRVLFFDDASMSGETVVGDIDHVYVPMVAEALNEYLFGSVNGKITSALDNTLRRVYNSDGAAIFSSVGTARLEYPRASYIQYVTGQWVTKAISETWMHPDIKAADMFAEMFKQAIENDGDRPGEWDKRKCYTDVIDDQFSPFYKEIKKRYFQDVSELYEDPAEEFFQTCVENIERKITEDNTVFDAKSMVDSAIKNKSQQQSINERLFSLDKAVGDFANYGYQYEAEVMRPTEAANDVFYEQNKDTKHLFNFIKSKKLHPIMLRYFLYKLYNYAKEHAEFSGKTERNFGSLEGMKTKDRLEKSGKYEMEIISEGIDECVANFASKMMQDLETYINEVEDMFKSLTEVVRQFDEKKRLSFNELGLIDDEVTTVLAGGHLSMMHTWNKVQSEIGLGEDIYTVDDDLNYQIHETVYKCFMDQVSEKKTTGTETAKDISGKKIRIRTRYDRIMARELQRYYTKLLNNNYSHCFPKNVIDAALIEIGLQNRYDDHKSRVDSTTKFTETIFMSRSPEPMNFKTDSEDKPAGAVSDATYLSTLLTRVINKSKPKCGRVDDIGTESGIINRLLVINKNLLRTKLDTRHTDEDGIAKEVYIENEIIEGVPSGRIGGNNVNTKYVTEGITIDEINCVTTLAGLQPANFVAFLPPDDNEHAPTSGESYYEAYKNAIDNVAVRDNYITPHLHRDWHLADRLEDLTQDHTDTYNRSTAEAFMYGFIFDVITVGYDGVVTIGKLGDSHFASVFGSNGQRDFSLLDANVHASINNSEESELSDDEKAAKRNVLNSVLVEIFTLLATSQPIRNAILSYAEAKMKEYETEQPDKFIFCCTESENICDIKYHCILDVMDGYYQGTRNLPYNELDRSDKNTGYMFSFLLKKTYDICKQLRPDRSTVKELYKALVGHYYHCAICDDGEDAVKTPAAPVVADVASADSTQDEKNQILMALFAKNTGRAKKRNVSPFAGGKPQDDGTYTPGGKYSLKNALEMIDIFFGAE